MIDVWVTGDTPGSYANVIRPADITSNEGRTLSGNISATLIITASDLTTSKSFYPNTVNPNGLSAFTITLQNTDPSALVNVSLLDNLPGNATNGVGNAMAQGKIYIAGDIGARGMTMTKHNPRFEPPELWVLGSVGDSFAEFMAGGVAVVKVGAATEVEMKEKKARVEDALAATRAAVEEGIVPGGGITLLHAAAVVEKLDLKDEEKIGADIVAKALYEPARMIAINAGQEGSVIVEKIKSQKSHEIGYNAATGEFVNMLEAGIVDPTKVSRSSLQNAASVAALLLTTEVIITDIPEKEKGPDMGAGGMGGMGGMM